MRSVAIILLVGIVSADLGAVACLLDCDAQSTSTTTIPVPACHETAGRESAGLQLTQSAVPCQREHGGPTAELRSRNDGRGLQSADLMYVGTASSSLVPPLTFEALSQSLPERTAQAPSGAPCPLRL